MNQRIFLVEDDSDIARLVCHHLETAGYVVRAFPAIAGVLGEAVKSRPALFLLDIMLHGGSGLALCEEIRQCETLAATPVIFLTAKSSESDRVLGFELGADDTTATEFRLLDYLVGRIGCVLTRDQLLGAVWRDTAFVIERSVDVYIWRLRMKIEDDPDEPRYLKTVRGSGYRFDVPQ